MERTLTNILTSLGELKGTLTICVDLIRANTARIQRIEQKVENADTRLKHIEKKSASPSSTPSASWHQVIALVIALLAGTMMNLAPKEIAGMVLRAWGK